MPEIRQTETARFHVSRIGGNIGAEIKGIRLSPHLETLERQFIYESLLTYKVIFFRNQTLTSSDQENLASLFGTLISHPTVHSPKGTNHIFELKAEDRRADNSWHMDMTFMAAFPRASILRCVHPAKSGGATVWANTAIAYQSLPRPLQEMADKLWAIHSNSDYDHTDLIIERDWDHVRWQTNVFAARVFEARHPLVHIHPETNERCLILGNFIRRLANLNLSDSRLLLQLFESYATRPEHSVTWYWQEGDVAIWDNRASLHRATDDFGGRHRELQRVTLAGDVPVSVDGQQSQQIINGRFNPVILLDEPYAWQARQS